MAHSDFRSMISSDPASEFPAAKDRYALYLQMGCPFSHRTIIVYHLKQLHGIVGLSVASIHRTPETGWQYDGTSGSDPVDAISGFSNFRQMYEKAVPGYTGRWSTPVLWDRERETIVNNESGDIIRMFYNSFDAFLAPELREVNKPGGGLLPSNSREEIDAMNQWMYDDVNWGVYKIGFSQSQEDYDEGMKRLYNALDIFEKRLSGQRYLFGDHITDADIRLYATSVRFDMAYVNVFRCNWKQIRYDYPNLHRWMRQLYWEVDKEVQGAFKSTTWVEIYMEGYAKTAMYQKVVPWGPAVPILPLDS